MAINSPASRRILRWSDLSTMLGEWVAIIPP
jgi:hypothetical protein